MILVSGSDDIKILGLNCTLIWNCRAWTPKKDLNSYLVQIRNETHLIFILICGLELKEKILFIHKMKK